jgi:putative ABC transport system permease protein
MRVQDNKSGRFNLTMILNYLKLSFRLLLRNPFFAAINISGLSVGFAAFYILWPYTQTELHSDRFHEDYRQIARLSWHHRWTDNNRDWHEFDNALNFCGVANQIAAEFSEVTDLTRFVPQRNFVKLQHGFGNRVFFAVYQSDSTKEFFREENTALADRNFFEFFNFPLVSGHPSAVLSQPGSVVISHHHSTKYFGNRNPINSIIYLNDSLPLKVTGVFKDLPRNTHFAFDVIITTEGMDDIDRWFSRDIQTNWLGGNYIKVNAGVRFSELQEKIDAKRRALFDSWPNTDPTAFVQPLDEIVFTDHIDNPFIYKSKNALVILQWLSVIILLLAWINYVSLSITTLHKRLPEVGTRKVVGARGRDFIMQFFFEAAIVNLSSLLLALTFVQLVKSPIEYLFHFYVADWKEIMKQHYLILSVVPLGGIVLTGIYPVIISSRKGVVELLRRLRSVETPWWIQSMVTFQYASAVVLLIWIGVAYFQLNYILNKNVGVKQEGILIVDCPLERTEQFNDKLDYFINESLQTDGVLQATVSKSVMGDPTGIPFFIQRNSGTIEMGMFSNGVVDEHFLDFFGIELLAGRNFRANYPADKKSILLSRMAAERLGYRNPKDAIGAKIILPRHDARDVEIIGVYEEYEFEPYFKDDQAKGNGSVLTYKNYLAKNIEASKVSFKIDLNRTSQIISHLENLYKETFPLETFRWDFLDQNIQRHYTQEKIVRNQIMLFTLVAIGIACLGLLGTTSNKAVEKTKEIGIRKVLGAGMHQIAQILLNTTARQVVIANIVGIPVAYFLVGEYLERYSERLPFHWWHFVLPVVMLLAIMSVTIAGTLIKAARTNPIESLRSE